MNIQRLPTEDRLSPELGVASGRAAGREFGIAELLEILSVRRWLIGGTAAVVVAIAVVAVHLLTPIYTATARVMVGERQNKLIDLESALAGLPIDTATVENQVQILQSRALLGKLVEKARLDLDPEFNTALAPKSGLASVFDALFGGDEPDATLPLASCGGDASACIVDRVRQALGVSAVGRSSVIEISISSEDPRKAAALTNQLADLYLLDQLEAKFEATRRASAWLSERIGYLADQVREAERAVEVYRAENNLTGAGSDGRSMVEQQLIDLNSQLTLARADLSAKEAKYEQASRLLQSGSIDSIAEVLASPLISGLRQQEAKLIGEESELRTRYGDRHPKIIDIRAQRSTLDAKIGQEARRIVTNLGNEVDVAKSRVATLQSNLDGLEAASGQQNLARVRLRELERNAEASRTLYENFLSRFKEAQDQEEIQTPDARIISAAVVPVTPSFPRKMLVIGVALVGGVLVGFLLGILLEQLDHGFRVGEDIERHLGIPQLALVPETKEPDSELTARVVRKPLSSFSESIRALRLAINMSNVDKPPKVVVVTSPLPGEGKTTIAISLARLAATTGQKVVLVDIDMRHPSVEDSLGVESSDGAGIAAVLSGEAPLEAAVRRDRISPLHYLRVERRVANPTALIDSQTMQNLLARLRQAYDLVVIDSAPLIPVTDTRLLARHADGVIFVVRWERTPREAARSALRMLQDLDVPVIGAVMSLVNMRRHAVYGYGAYGSYYGYGKYYAKYYSE